MSKKKPIAYITPSGGLMIPKNGKLFKFCPYSFKIIEHNMTAQLTDQPWFSEFEPVYEGEELTLNLTYRSW